jgi:hypothetical protein
MAAEEAAKMELMIVDKTKSAGGVSITVDGMSHSQTVNNATKMTGLLEDMKLESQLGGMVAGQEALQDGDATEDGDQPQAHRQAVASRMVDIGFVYDSVDDDARLALVHSYRGTKRVKVFALGDSEDDTTERLGSKAGRVSLNDDGTASTDAEDANNTVLTPVGYYYEATNVNADDGLGAADVVGAEAKARRVYKVTTPGPNDAVDTDDVTLYLVLTTSETDANTGDVDYTYRVVEIEVARPDLGATETSEVLATLPSASEYEHIHFGVWASIGEADEEGMNMPSELGIGFVQNYSDGGMTGADMPNNGTGTYMGDWVANVRSADDQGDGDISLKHGGAMLSADFGKGEITATLTGLAVLEGDITTNTFSGTDAEVMAGDPHGLDAAGKFTGSFEGAFYGDKAAEAGGVFDFTSKDMEAGEFRGAFGGGRTDN